MSKVAPGPELPADYVWSFPGVPVLIHLSLNVVSRLRQALDSDVSQSREVGGLLLGKAQPGRIDISDFQAFAQESGSRYFVLSSHERIALKKVMQSRQDNLPDVVGYFRSDLRTGIRLTDEDLSLIKDLFCDPANVFLIVHPEENNPPAAGFFFWDAGSIFAEASFMQFPLEQRLLAVARPAHPLHESSILDEPEPDKPEKHAAPAGRRRLLYALCVLTLAVAGAGIFYTWSRQEPPHNASVSPPYVPEPRAASPMSLSASRTDKTVSITWDTRLPAVSGARIGILTIRDGTSQTELPLTKSQLQISKLIYTPQTDRLEITLEVFSPSGVPSQESIMLVSREPAVQSRSRLQSPAERNQEPVTRTFVAPPLAVRKDTPEPIIVTDTPPQPGTAISDLAAIRSPDFLAPLSIPQASPATPEKQVSRVIPLQLPKPVRQIRPALPPNITAMLKRGVDVPVRVSIDENGRVKHAEAVMPPGGLNQYLGATAANAARLWTFQPARRGDTAVVSELVLHFTFGPGK